MRAQYKEDKDEDFIQGANISNLNEDETISSSDVSSSELGNIITMLIYRLGQRKIYKHHQHAHFLFERYKLTQVAANEIAQ